MGREREDENMVDKTSREKLKIYAFRIGLGIWPRSLRKKKPVK